MAKKRLRSKAGPITVLKGKVLGVPVYRGFAPLSLLAQISKADVYDQQHNPSGTQRGLSPKHARDAYAYVATKDFAFWPEVFLCVRDKTAFKFRTLGRSSGVGTITIYLTRTARKHPIAISRVDGNHRLYYADGSQKGFLPVDKQVSFCIAYNLSLEQEMALFRDINRNQKAMNTSHLDNIDVQLTPEEELKKKSPSLYMARKLSKDTKSPFHGRVYEGGRKRSNVLIPLRSLNTGIEYMLSQPSHLTALPHVDAQYRVIRSYFNAAKQWQRSAWENPKDYLLLRGAGFWSLCFLGADTIDRVLRKKQFSSAGMLKVLKSGKEWDWTNRGDFHGMSGRAGAKKIRDQIVSEWEDESGETAKDLVARIMEE